MAALSNVDYQSLDRAKNAFIDAARRTLKFAESFGFIPGESLGASANIFSLDLSRFIKNKENRLYITLLPEGLGTADDARPEDLSSEEALKFWRNIAYKTMSSLTNDAAASGLQTILIGLYLPSSTPELVFNESFMRGFLDGIVEACREVGCVYFSGETPQLKNKILPNKLDIAGALFALSPPGCAPIDGSALAAGDRIVMLQSSGPHENGFTVLRELAETLPQGYRTKLPGGLEYWEAINAPSLLYTAFVQRMLKAGIKPSALENITGHGWQKVMRSGKKLRYRIKEMLPVPEIFKFVEQHAKKTPEEMLKIFNYGTGQVSFFKSDEDAAKAVAIAEELGIKAVSAGVVEESSEREVLVEPLGVKLRSSDFALSKS